MDIKRIGDVFVHHYEKIILTLALVGLAVTVWLLMKFSEEEHENLQKYVTQVERRAGASVKPVDMSQLEGEIKQAQNPPNLELSGAHNLFNPVKWRKKPDGTFIKDISGFESTLGEVQVTAIRPLIYWIAFDKWNGLSGYSFIITNQALYPRGRIPNTVYSLNDTNKPLLILREVKGVPENPSELVLEMKDSGERIAVAKDRPFVRTNTYEADLRYNIDNKSFNKEKTNSVVKVGGEDYKIVAINPNEVVMSAANDKKYTLRYQPGR
jgi:hypothetical protein